VQDLPERMVRPEKYLWTEHSEANLVASAARPRLKGTTVYVTHLCCNACARLLVSSGVGKVVMADEPTSMPTELHETALAILKEAGVAVEYYSPTESKQ
jgi:dCMP deaminase